MKAFVLLVLISLNVNAQVVTAVKSGQLTSAGEVSEMETFYKVLTDKIKYTAFAVENEHHGRLSALFIIDKNRKVKYIKISESPHDQVSELVLNALKNIEYPKVIKSERSYIIPINFKILAVRYAHATPVPLPDSIQAKVSRPVSVASSIVYNPTRVKLPSKNNPILLHEVTKYGYKGYAIHTME